MSDEAYNDLLHGNGYHQLRGVISAQEAAAVRDLTLTRLDEGTEYSALGPNHPKYGDKPHAAGFGSQITG